MINHLKLEELENKEIFRIEVLALDNRFSIKELAGKNLPIIPYKEI